MDNPRYFCQVRMLSNYHYCIFQVKYKPHSDCTRRLVCDIILIDVIVVHIICCNNMGNYELSLGRGTTSRQNVQTVQQPDWPQCA